MSRPSKGPADAVPARSSQCCPQRLPKMLTMANPSLVWWTKHSPIRTAPATLPPARAAAPQHILSALLNLTPPSLQTGVRTCWLLFPVLICAASACARRRGRQSHLHRAAGSNSGQAQWVGCSRRAVSAMPQWCKAPLHYTTHALRVADFLVIVFSLMQH